MIELDFSKGDGLLPAIALRYVVLYISGVSASRVLTLSEEQLVLLDWHSSSHRGARVKSRKAVAGPGVDGIFNEVAAL